MKLAIHHRPHSYSEHWITYCQKNNIQYKIVDAYANDILEQVSDCDAFIWHQHFHQYKDCLFAKNLMYVIEKQMGKITYPSFDSCWHYDDKMGQKYLLEAIGAPIVPTYIFYTRQKALEWIKQTTFPKVFKLRCGASSSNVQLIKTYSQAKRIINDAFGKGIKTLRYFEHIKEQYIKYQRGQVSFRSLLGLIKMWLFHISTIEYYKYHPKEYGYVYFQDFIPNNDSDIRVYVVGNKAIAAKRMNRENDFRASGSGKLIYDKEQIDEDCIKIAFETCRKLHMQSVAFDFLHNTNGDWVITEISYCRDNKNKGHTGYWTDDLQWHKYQNINICDWIIEDVITKVRNQ